MHCPQRAAPSRLFEIECAVKQVDHPIDAEIRVQPTSCQSRLAAVLIGTKLTGHSTSCWNPPKTQEPVPLLATHVVDPIGVQC